MEKRFALIVRMIYLLVISTKNIETNQKHKMFVNLVVINPHQKR